MKARKILSILTLAALLGSITNLNVFAATTVTPADGLPEVGTVLVDDNLNDLTAGNVDAVIMGADRSADNPVNFISKPNGTTNYISVVEDNGDKYLECNNSRFITLTAKEPINSSKLVISFDYKFVSTTTTAKYDKLQIYGKKTDADFITGGINDSDSAFSLQTYLESALIKAGSEATSEFSVNDYRSRLELGYNTAGWNNFAFIFERTSDNNINLTDLRVNGKSAFSTTGVTNNLTNTNLTKYLKWWEDDCKISLVTMYNNVVDIDNILVYAPAGSIAETPLSIVDNSGTEITGVTAGDTVFAKVNLTNEQTEGAIERYVILACYDSNRNLTGVEASKVTVNAQETYKGNPVSVVIPEGTATVRAFVWDYNDLTPYYTAEK